MPFYIVLLLMIAPYGLWAQNLVLNPGFEQANCPTGYTGLPSQVQNWMPHWYSANCASPDPLTHCSTDSNTSVPRVWFGHQQAHGGNNFLGMSFYMIGEQPWYEYVGTRLGQALVAGQVYEVSLYVSKAEQARYATSELGVYFSTHKDSCAGGFAGRY